MNKYTKMYKITKSIQEKNLPITIKADVTQLAGKDIKMEIINMPHTVEDDKI